MKVLMYGWEFPPHISGGLGMACYGIVHALAKKSIGITFVLPYALENLTQSDNMSIIDCNSFKSAVNISLLKSSVKIKKVDALLHPYMSNENYLQTLANVAKCKSSLTGFGSIKLTGHYGQDLLSEVFHYAVAAGSLASTVPHDVIHAHDWLTVLAGIEARELSGKPLVFHVHALEPDRSGKSINQNIFDIEKYGMEQADRIVSVSQYTKNVITNYYKIDPKKIIVVHNGIFKVNDIPQRTQRKPNWKMVLFLGRVTHQKGPYFFVEVAKKILASRGDVHFVVAGSGDMLQGMIEQVAAANIGSNVHFTGFLNQELVKKLYQLADVYIMPSESEPFGLAPLEALAYNVPVIISKQSGVSEVLKNVFKVDFWDVDQMAARTLALLDYRGLRKEMLSNAVEELQDITWERTVDKLIGIYKEII